MGRTGLLIYCIGLDRFLSERDEPHEVDCPYCEHRHLNTCPTLPFGKCKGCPTCAKTKEP